MLLQVDREFVLLGPNMMLKQIRANESLKIASFYELFEVLNICEGYKPYREQLQQLRQCDEQREMHAEYTMSAITDFFKKSGNNLSLLKFLADGLVTNSTTAVSALAGYSRTLLGSLIQQHPEIKQLLPALIPLVGKHIKSSGRNPQRALAAIKLLVLLGRYYCDIYAEILVDTHLVGNLHRIVRNYITLDKAELVSSAKILLRDLGQVKSVKVTQKRFPKTLCETPFF